MRAKEILDTAASLVTGERNHQHGDMETNLSAMAAILNGYLVARVTTGRSPTNLDAHDVACIMELFKIARRHSGAFNIDDYVDGAGYAAIAGEIASSAGVGAIAAGGSGLGAALS